MGRDDDFSLFLLLLAHKYIVFLITIGATFEIENYDVHVVGTNVNLPRFSENDFFTRHTEIKVANRKSVCLAPGSVAHHAVCGVVSAGGEGAFDDALSRMVDRFDGRVSPLDDQGLHALVVSIHDVEFHILALVVGNPISVVEKQNAVDGGSRGIFIVVRE